MSDAAGIALNDRTTIPQVGFGTFLIPSESTAQAVRTALEAGYRHIDTAQMYGNERGVGRGVRDSGLPREDVFVTTKLQPRDAGRERRTLEASLRALAMEYLDLWLVHWPPARGASPQVWKQFLALRDEGLTRAVGVSNYSIAELDELVRATGEAPEVNQIRWGPTLYDPEELQEHRQRGVVLEGYSPFKTTNLRHPVLVEVAARHGVTAAQVVVRWHVEHRVVVIPKSATPERVESNFDVFGFSLDDEDVRRIDGLARG
jgi:2,5-diketo-D-gluconate reductase A